MIEVKSFIGVSTIFEFHIALGQYMDYLLALEDEEPDRALYMAVPADTYATFFSLQFIQKAVQRYQLKLLVYDQEDEVIIRWKK